MAQIPSCIAWVAQASPYQGCKPAGKSVAARRKCRYMVAYPLELRVILEKYMTDQQLIEELLKDRSDNSAVDEACYKRLRRLAADYGDNGKIAAALLDVVRRLLDM